MDPAAVPSSERETHEETETAAKAALLAEAAAASGHTEAESTWIAPVPGEGVSPEVPLAPHLRRLAPGERRRPRVGVMGGTFDPIHNGHLVAASEAAWVFDLDEVVFVPTGRPSFKQNRQVTPAEHRYLMTVIATAANPRFSVSRVDIDRPGITYTIDTLKDLHAERPEADLYFITGADAIHEIATWKDADKLWGLAHFVAVSRPGHRLSTEGIPRGAVTKLEIPALAISSTDCRIRAERGIPVWYLVPDGVVQYISKHGIYRRHGVRGEGPVAGLTVVSPQRRAR